MLAPWPFATVPNSERARLWAGRAEHLSQLNGLLSRWKRRRASEICVLWADFGQGKTHSLMYLQNRLADDVECTAHYAQLPPLTGGSPFVALYRQVMRNLPLEKLAARIFHHFESSPMSIFRSGPSSDRLVYQLLWLVATRAPSHDLAARWLRGEPAGPSELSALQIGGRSLGLTMPLKTAADCQATLDSVVNVATEFPPGEEREIVLLLDEFQRIGELTPSSKRIEVCNAIHLLFNSHPQNLRLVLAFAGGERNIINKVLTPDLQHRIHSRLDYAPLDVKDGVEYVAELLACYAVESRPDRFSPFTVDAVTHLVRGADDGTGMLSPRAINIVFDKVINVLLDSRSAQNRNMEDDISLAEVKTIMAAQAHLAGQN